MHTELLTVTHEGWFLFCPCWFTDMHERSDAACPIPKWRMWWLLDMCTTLSLIINFFIGLIDSDACGFGMWVRELDEPIRVQIEVEDDNEQWPPEVHV